MISNVVLCGWSGQPAETSDCCGPRLLAPLLLARDAVVVAIHLSTRAVLEEERRFGAGGHLRTVDSTIAFERRHGPAFRYRRWCGLSCGWSRCLNGRLDFRVALVFGVAIPPERSND